MNSAKLNPKTNEHQILTMLGKLTSTKLFKGRSLKDNLHFLFIEDILYIPFKQEMVGAEYVTVNYEKLPIITQTLYGDPYKDPLFLTMAEDPDDVHLFVDTFIRGSTGLFFGVNLTSQKELNTLLQQLPVADIIVRTISEDDIIIMIPLKSCLTKKGQ